MKTILAIILSCVITAPSNLYTADATVIRNQNSVLEFEIENGHTYAAEWSICAAAMVISCPVGASCITLLDSCGTTDPADDVLVCVALNAI